jgi:ankyrin repeat protein
MGNQANKALFDAAYNGDLQKLLEAIKHNAEVDSLHESDFTLFEKWTSLHMASCLGYVEIVKALIEAKASVNITVGWGCPPLEVAAMWGRKEVMEILINAGADPDAVSASSGKTAAEIYAEYESNHRFDEIVTKN